MAARHVGGVRDAPVTAPPRPHLRAPGPPRTPLPAPATAALSVHGVRHLQRAVGNAAVGRLLAGAGTPTAQRLLDPAALRAVHDEVDVRTTVAGVLRRVAEYNAHDLQPPPFGGTSRVTLRAVDDQLARLDALRGWAAGRDVTGPTLDALVDLDVQSAAERTRLEGLRLALEVCAQHDLPADRVLGLLTEPGGRRVVDALVAARASKPTHAVFGTLLRNPDVVPRVLLTVMPLVLEGQKLRLFMAQLSPQDPRLSAGGLVAFVEGYERLLDWFEFLLETRRLPRESFVHPFEVAVDKLFRGEADYTTLAARLSTALPNGVTILEIAHELSEGMAQLGYTVFLAGGGAIAFHGGHRPVSDLDFRMDPLPGMTTFSGPQGKQVLHMVNRLLEISKSRRAQGLTFSQFSAAGKKALTIGTHDWFSVEVSISLNQGFAHGAPAPRALPTHSADYVRHVDPTASPTTSVPLLGLTDLLRDKLKTAVTRTKEAEVSHKKVAQDLFDILDLVLLLRRLGIDPLDPTSLRQHLRARVDQYRVQNLEPPDVDLGALTVVEVAERMLYRLVRTAQAHAVPGPRRDVLLHLSAHSSADVLSVLDEVVGIPLRPRIEVFGELDVDAWFRTWAVQGATTEEHRRVPGQNPHLGPYAAPDDQPDVFPGNALVADILAGAPSFVLADEDLLILYVLYRSAGGLRPLVNSRSAIEVMVAFSAAISVKRFSQFFETFGPRGRDQLVQDEPAGLRLLRLGRVLIAERLRH
ncbi:hypothetical protein OMK64_17180 [Cellulomonas fimi]|uniref:hypothetical protein n=1 Tax=Cellulomonas fimi TaxID=1708 RepID=UPI00234C7AF5|nr:hypothetical protein [Cellulomonas fimi]MDC7123265.1 hypothetical protein [Cellulomonas fimi]